MLPRRGTTVTTLTLKGVLDNLRPMRQLSAVSPTWPPSARPMTNSHMESLVELVDEARESPDTEKYLLADYQIHHFLVKTIDNSLLRSAADRLLLHNFASGAFTAQPSP